VLREKSLSFTEADVRNTMSSSGRRARRYPNLFEEREQMLLAPYEGEEKLPPDAPEIGIPGFFHFHEMSPFWRAFFTGIGLSGSSFRM